LINKWSGLTDFSRRHRKHQFAVVPDRDVFGALETQADDLGVNTWGDDEVILHLPLIAVVEKVDTG